ncbi:MAG TPA: hypothetical protein VJ717_16960 [Gemmatimonadaceae bacterium]|nr:hypothetical protein [Gemmatimonadaceae bacterium]
MTRYLLGIVLAASSLSGCYKYTRVQANEVAQGVSVRARVNAAASDRIAPLLGTAPRQLTGTLISDQRDTVIMEVPSVVQTEAGSIVQTLHQRVALPKADVIEWEIRTLDRPRTYALIGGAAVLAVSALYGALKGEPGSERTPNGGGMDALVLLLRFSR